MRAVPRVMVTSVQRVHGEGSRAPRVGADADRRLVVAALFRVAFHDADAETGIGLANPADARVRRPDRIRMEYGHRRLGGPRTPAEGAGGRSSDTGLLSS